MLQDDCFQHTPDLLLHGQAIDLLRQRVSPISKPETVPLRESAGRFLAEPVVAAGAVPAHTNAAVDGYAFAYSDYDPDNGSSLRVAGRASAGHPYTGQWQSGDSVRIFTGAVVPAGCDTVVMQEDIRRVQSGDGLSVAIPSGLRAGANVRQAGEDVPAGEVLFEPGHLVRPQDLAALASIGTGRAACFRRLNVAIVSTGDEVVPAGRIALRDGQVFDANAPMLAALTALAGANAADLGIWPDDPGIVRRRLQDAVRSHDVILTSGGASGGEEDHMAAALSELGQRHFWQIAVKPGRPIMFGQSEGTPIIGLPGNPVAVFVCFLMYVFPVLRRLGGGHWPEPRRLSLPAAFNVPKRKTGRRDFWRAAIVPSASGLTVKKFARDGSGLISSLRAADGLVEVDEETPSVAEGELVAFIPFSEFGIL